MILRFWFVLLLWLLCASCAVLGPSTGRDVSASAGLEVIATSAGGSLALVDGRIAPPAEGTRVVLLERSGGTEREAAVWRRGTMYEVVVRHGREIERPSHADLDWIEAKLSLRDADFFTTNEDGLERQRIEHAHIHLTAPVLKLRSVREAAPSIVFPALLVPDLLAAVRREHLSEAEEVALVALCFEELDLPPIP